LKRIVVLLGWVLPLCAQYAGPAILSRGDAPAAMAAPQISFRPFIEVSGVYDTGLAGVAVNDQGELASTTAEGVELAFGISGSHSWRHTQLGLDYRGDVRRYNQATNYDSTDHSLLLGIKHQFTRHILLNLRESAGMFSQNDGLLGLPQTVPFDPSQSFIPTTDFFDNRTIYGSTQADLIIQKSSRLSFDFGGSGFLTRRRSSALYGVTGAEARADVQYRISRRTTIGGNYSYTHYSFTGIFSSTDMHGANATFATQFARRLELSGYAGAARVETKFIQTVPVDPAITAILGITEGTRVAYSVRYIPTLSVRLSQTLSRGVLYLAGGHSVTPGNGLFLTSSVTNISGGYSYTGLRRWSFNAQAGYNDSESIGNVIGRYKDLDASVTASRQVSRSIHAIFGFTARKYESGDFSQYNRVVYMARVGVGFTPGDVPLRVW
jgi:hypothetical protein